MAITLEITSGTSLDIGNSAVELTLNTAAVPAAVAAGIAFTPYNTITANTLQEALEQLADQSFRTTTTPVGSNIEQGDQWYNPDTEQLYVYRETSPGVIEWVPIMIGNDSPNSDTVDAGAF